MELATPAFYQGVEKERNIPITVYITADTLISSLGANTRENIKAIREYQSGITRHEAGIISDTSILAATIQPEQWERAKNLGTYTRLEQLFILAIQDILSHSEMNLADEDCGLILSTTKGNIDLLANHPDTPDIRVHLWEMGRRISEYFQAATG